jgi:hypothetical protein
MIALKKLYLNVGILTESLINKPKKYKMKNTKTGNSLLFRIIKSAPLFIILLQSTFLFSQNDDNINSRDILYLTSGGKLIPQQAIMDIRHYTIALEVDMINHSINGATEVSLNLSKKRIPSCST